MSYSIEKKTKQDGFDLDFASVELHNHRVVVMAES